MEEFNALRLRDVSTLSEEERVMLRKIGEQLTEDERLKLIGKSTWDKIVNSISSEDLKKIQGWKNPPSEEVYLKNKKYLIILNIIIKQQENLFGQDKWRP